MEVMTIIIGIFIVLGVSIWYASQSLKEENNIYDEDE